MSTLPDSLVQPITDLIHQMSDEARTIALQYYRKADVGEETKEDDSPVTLADKAIEQMMRERIEAAFPTHRIMGEEFDDKAGSEEITWVLDPIDGTRQFVLGMPLFGNLIGVLAGDKPVLGCINIPMTQERWIGQMGQGTTLNGQACRVSSVTKLSEARLMATAPAQFSGAQRTRFGHLIDLTKDVRFGTDCYAYGLLASGHCDVVAEASLKSVDIMATIPVIQAAGGVTSDWHGKPVSLDGDGTFLAAATPELHDTALALLNL